MYQYKRKVQYHETDKMGVTHHSNYIKWLEEARIDFLESIGCGYTTVEKEGIVSPVVGIDCKYKHTTTFDDVVNIGVSIKEYKSVKLVLEYKITNEKTNDLVLEGKTVHCFIDKNGKIVSLKKTLPNIDEKLQEHIKTDES